MVSEKGLLQLLFDVKFLAEVLSGGANLSPDSLPEREEDFSAQIHLKRRTTDASVVSRRNRVSSLLDSILQKLDPVDAAM